MIGGRSGRRSGRPADAEGATRALPCRARPGTATGTVRATARPAAKAGARTSALVSGLVGAALDVTEREARALLVGDVGLADSD